MVDVLVHDSAGVRSIDEFKTDSQSVALGTPGKELWVTRYGDTSKTPMLFLHDVALNHESCFRSFLNHVVGPDAPFQLLDHFSIIGVDWPGARTETSWDPKVWGDLSLQSFAKDIESLCIALNLPTAMFGFGMGAGGTVLSIQALRFPLRYRGLVLITPSATPSTSLEWASFRPLSASLSRLGSSPLSGLALSQTLQLTVNHSGDGPASPDALAFFEGALSEQRADVVLSQFSAVLSRPDLCRFAESGAVPMREAPGMATARGVVGGAWGWIGGIGTRIARVIGLAPEGTPRVPDDDSADPVRLGLMRPRVLVFAGEDGYYFQDTVDFYSALPRDGKAWVKFKNVGGMVHEERPGEIFVPLRLFLQGFGYDV